jgi:hypothetical protein
MGSAAQTRAIENYRKRLSKRGMARFEVVGLKSDQELIRSIARRLADDTPEADEMRASMRQTITEKSSTKGGILAWLRSSPLVGADLNLKRPFTTGRKIDL